MIQVLLLILKIIGIVLMSIVGVLLLSVLLLLFVPVFYRVRIIHNPEETQVKARVSFLFPLLLITVEYLKKLSFRLRILGISVLNSEKPKKEKKVPEKRKPKQMEKPVESVNKPVKPEIKENSNETKKEKISPQLSEKQGFFDKTRSKIVKIRETISNIICKIKKMLHKKEEVQRILSKPETKKVFSFCWNKFKGLLKHIFPRKIKGYVAFGADDPATTGKILGGLGVLYAKTGQLLEIRPNFQEKQLECDVELKGRVQVFTLLVIALKVFLNQELRQLIAEFKGLKETE